MALILVNHRSFVMRNSFQKKLFFIMALVGPFLSCQAQQATVPMKANINKAQLAASLDKRIPQLLDSANIPGISLAVISNGNIIYAKAYGIRNTETKEKVDVETIFDAASLSKVVFAYAVLKLVEEGLITLDKPLYQYLPYEDIKRDGRYQKITARMVLSHSTGFPNWRGGDSLRINFEPGKQFKYSGEGFVYLQKVVEKLSGKSLQGVMEEKVFKPLQMTRSSYVWKKEFDTNFATPHDGIGNAKFKNKPAQAKAAYSLQTTAIDYATFITAILNEKGLSKKTVQDMLTTQIQVPDDENNLSLQSKTISWGLGVGLQETTDEKAFWHWGDNNTFKCYVVAYKKEKTGSSIFYKQL
jgi:CubicO group peptidase (beta-lactamase class C family)